MSGRMPRAKPSKFFDGGDPKQAEEAALLNQFRAGPAPLMKAAE
jgi:hypothetical protein